MSSRVKSLWVILSISVVAMVPSVTIVSAVPQASAPTPNPTVTIDGSKTPELIPEWILWREVFHLAAALSEKAPKAGDEIWAKHLGMSSGDKEKLLARALALRNNEKDFDKKAKDIIDFLPEFVSKETKKQLKDLHESKKNKILEHRDTLKSEIGETFYARLKSWARLHIAPGIKVGDLGIESEASDASVPNH